MIEAPVFWAEQPERILAEQSPVTENQKQMEIKRQRAERLPSTSKRQKIQDTDTILGDAMKQFFKVLADGLSQGLAGGNSSKESGDFSGLQKAQEASARAQEASAKALEASAEAMKDLARAQERGAQATEKLSETLASFLKAMMEAKKGE